MNIDTDIDSNDGSTEKGDKTRDKKFQRFWNALFLPAALEYLAACGPVSRIERYFLKISKSIGCKGHAFITPTTVFINVAAKGREKTYFSRTNTADLNFRKIIYIEQSWDRLVQGLAFDFYQFNKGLKNLEDNSLWLKFVAVFVIGFVASFVEFHLIFSAFLSGMLAIVAFGCRELLGKHTRSIGVINVFLTCLICALLSFTGYFLFHTPVEYTSYGFLLLLVPGILLTNCISEMAEENYISGSVKLNQAILNILALGSAFLLMYDFGRQWVVSTSAPSELDIFLRIPDSFVLDYIAIAFMLAAFGVIFNIPYQYFVGIIIVGELSFALLQFMKDYDYIILGVFLPAFAVGLVSLIIGKIVKVPSQVFSLPGILTLLPGMLALSSLFNYSHGNYTSIVQIVIRTALAATSIAFGLLLAKLVMNVMGKQTAYDEL